MSEAARDTSTPDQARPSSATAFARWMAHMRYTKEQAAAALGFTPSWVNSLKQGRNYKTGDPAKPDLRTRLAMRARAEGLEPWPDD